MQDKVERDEIIDKSIVNGLVNLEQFLLNALVFFKNIYFYLLKNKEKISFDKMKEIEKYFSDLKLDDLKFSDLQKLENLIYVKEEQNE